VPPVQAGQGPQATRPLMRLNWQKIIKTRFCVNGMITKTGPKPLFFLFNSHHVTVFIHLSPLYLKLPPTAITVKEFPVSKILLDTIQICGKFTLEGQ
jgi:hypothetical protein